MKKYLVCVPVMAKVEVCVEAENEEQAMEIAMFKAEFNKEDINSDTVEPVIFDGTIEGIQNRLTEFAITEGYLVLDYKEEFGDI